MTSNDIIFIALVVTTLSLQLTVFFLNLRVTKLEDEVKNLNELYGLKKE